METGALPIELRPSVRGPSVALGGDYDRRVALAALFTVITIAFAGIAVGSASAGRWVIALAAAALAFWMGTFAWAALRRSRS